VVQELEVRPRAVVEWGTDPHRAARPALEAIFSLTRAADAQAMRHATAACVQMASVAQRNSHVETSVVTPAKCVPFKNVPFLEQRVPIRTNAVLRNIVNIHWVIRAMGEMPTLAVWAGRKCLRENVCQGRPRARQECLRRNPMIR
jgi:hypothetical protein